MPRNDTSTVRLWGFFRKTGGEGRYRERGGKRGGRVGEMRFKVVLDSGDLDNWLAG